ncbi:Hypothetical protein CINCED_3A002733 [Cinara cedri]|uniref:Uncharacterized protein n=1 Tax=Cinara cedri TaxID=506608 RepID=A0A5E4N2X3_9HEMI|nr:Hypothetical protein CINCED_3A002733 [Cinara cedri]
MLAPNITTKRKPPALKSLSICQPVQSNNAQKQKNKTSPNITPKTSPKPNPLRTTSSPSPLQQSSSKSTQNVINSETFNNIDNSKQSFASTVANSLIPKKDQAIIIDINDNLPHIDYIIAIGKLVQPANILFASRISKGRICILLSNKSLIDSLIINHPIISIQNQHFKLRKLFNPNKRIILSNIYRNIPPDIIANEFVKLNIPLCSPITFLRAGIQSQGHIASQCSNQNNSQITTSKENKVISTHNTASKLDDTKKTDITPIVAHPLLDNKTSPIEASNIQPL